MGFIEKKRKINLMVSQNEFIEKVSAQAKTRNKYFMRLFRFLAKFKIIKHDNYSNKESRPFTYMTICNQKSFFMLKASLYSFLKTTYYLPEKIVIVSDGSWETSTGEIYFSEFKVKIICLSWQTCAEIYKTKNQPFYKWANLQIWGKKMAAILGQAKTSLVIFSDSDVLWFNNIIDNKDFKEEKILKLTLDNSHNYDEKLLKELKLKSIFQKPAINCGVVKIKGDMFLHSSYLQKAIEFEARTTGNFSEQTIFAIMVAEFGSYFSDTEITASIEDIVSPIFRKSIYSKDRKARHYVWFLKWLFWRDYISVI